MTSRVISSPFSPIIYVSRCFIDSCTSLNFDANHLYIINIDWQDSRFNVLSYLKNREDREERKLIGRKTQVKRRLSREMKFDKLEKRC